MATQKPPQSRLLAIVTGASSGIGRELAAIAAQEGFDLIVAADTPLNEAIEQFQALGANVEGIQCDLATQEGVDKVVRAVGERPVAALLANAGHGLGHGFLDQDFEAAMHVIETNVTGTLYLVHEIGRRMRAAGNGRILFTGSIAGYMPGSYQAVYNATKAFVDSFALALRNELQDTGVTVTCLMPGVTDTEFFERAELMDTKVGTQENKADPAEVARIGFDAMMRGEADVVAGLKNKLQVAMAGITPKEALAEQHRKMAEPGTARDN
ncbi:MAG TPA: SDR family NAD(P)-dependent oxidoreductase [Steroidobacteraceae bacterium]|nr:SDR family NAD(P)-dependent oxidoreductase [Steroidobacteraceae bacterium]